MTKATTKLPRPRSRSRAATTKPRTKIWIIPTRKQVPEHQEPDIGDMEFFYWFLHQNQEATWQILPESENCTVKPKTLHGTLIDVERELIDANLEGAGIFICPNTVKGERASKNVTKVNVLFIDADGTMSFNKIKKLEPDLVIETSPGKFHVYWWVSDVKLDEFKMMQQALAKKFGTDKSVCDLARIMRVPGTLNHKYEDTRWLAQRVYLNGKAKRVRARRLLERLGVTIADRNTETVATLDDALDDVPAAADRATGKHDPVEIASALQAIAPSDERDIWLNVGMALHSEMPGKAGQNLWMEWSKQSRKYDADDQLETWNSFKSKGTGRVTIRSLFKMAKEHGWKAPPRKSKFPTTAFGLVDYFAARIAKRLCFVPETGSWYYFDQPIWIADEAKVHQHARRTLESLLERARAADDKDAVQLFSTRATVQGIKSLLNDAATIPLVNVKLADFDQKAHLLAVANGVVNLKTGGFRLGRPKDRLMIKAPAVFDENAKCPLFVKFVKFITKGRPDYIRYLQRALGYSLWGHTNMQQFFVVCGESGNGKGTLFHSMKEVLGPFVTIVAPNLLSKAYSGNPNAPQPAIMALRRARMFQCTESGDGDKFDTAFIKQISGSDMLTGRALQGDQVQFSPVGKLWLSTNTLPEVAQQDEAMWRRMRILPFDAKIKNRDGDVEKRMYLEAPGILNWLICGAVKAGKSKGLPACEAVKKATRAARRNCDSVALWLGARCTTRKDSKVQASDAFASYVKFCRQQSIHALGNQKFVKALVAKNIRHVRTSAFNAYEGIELKGE